MTYERQSRESAPGGATLREGVELLGAMAKGAYAAEPVRSAAPAAGYGTGNGATHAQSDLPLPPHPESELASSEDLFVQLRKRLAEADRQARLYTDAQQEIDRLRVDLGRVRAQAEAEVAQAEKEKTEAVAALADLKRRIRAVVGND